MTAFGAGDDPATRTVLPAATEFPWALGLGLALALISAVTCVLTGRVAGALMALPVVPAVWLDAPQRSEVVVTLAAACGLVAVLASPMPRRVPSARFPLGVIASRGRLTLVRLGSMSRSKGPR